MEDLQNQLAELLDEIQVAVAVVELDDGHITYINSAGSQEVGRAPEDILGCHYRKAFSPEFTDLFEALKADCEDGQPHTRVFYWMKKRLWERIFALRINWRGETPAILLSSTNITASENDMHTYDRMVRYDSKLGIPNGVKLEEDISLLDFPEKVALLYMEIDHFENLNELYGFDVGDAFLEQVRDYLHETETKEAQIYRVANGFALLGRNVTEQDAIIRAEQILERFKHPWLIGAVNTVVPLYRIVNIGIVYGKYVKNEMRNLLLRTSKAPKNSQGFALYDEQTDASVKQHLWLRQMLGNCVMHDMEGFSICYQPIVERETHRWVGAEALCRWKTPQGEEISPLTFIHLAEQMGLIKQLDNWVRETAMAQCVGWGLHVKDFTLDVNFSPSQAINDGFIRDLLSSMLHTGYPALQLNMEVTESAKMTFGETDLEGLRRLRAEGVLLSLDDFGTGYSSFENLRKIPCSLLKTEKLFLEQIETDAYQQYLLKILIDITHHLGMKIICEGVESEVQCELLERYGADYMQGFFFSRPLTVEQFGKETWRYRDRHS